jgi:hypothetical protein
MVGAPARAGVMAAVASPVNARLTQIIDIALFILFLSFILFVKKAATAILTVHKGLIGTARIIERKIWVGSSAS